MKIWNFLFALVLSFAISFPRANGEISVSRYDASTFLIEGDEEDDYIGVIHAANGAGVTINNVFYANANGVLIYGGPGNDWIDLDASANTDPSGSYIGGEEGDDTIVVVADDFGYYQGNEDNDTIYLLDTTDCTVDGDEGNDGIYIAGANVDAYADGGEGDDGIEALHNTSAVRLRGGPGSDIILSSPYVDTVNGDYYTTAPGTDTLYQIDNVTDNHSNFENVYGNPPPPR